MPTLFSIEGLLVALNVVLFAADLVVVWPLIKRWVDNNEWIGRLDFVWRRHRAERRLHR